MKNKRNRFGRLLWKAFWYGIATVSLSIVFYGLTALFFSTPEEKRLIRENRMYRDLYPDLLDKERLLGDVVEGLQEKDNNLYRGLFYTEAPAPDPLTAADVIADSDTLSDNFYLSYSASKSETAMKMASRVEENFREIFETLVQRRDTVPPLTLPIGNMSYIRTGASVGMKVHPFMKVEMRHDGIDLVARPGEPVYAAAAGTVVSVERSAGGLGNVVEISHGNGFVTRYACLSDVSVSRGNRVKAGKQIGTVGISRGSFAPHLHYEVRCKGKVLDPVHHFFASATPAEYANMLFMAVSTGQSMD